jgi:hypothetical protein
LLKTCLQLCLSGLIGLLSLCNRPIFGPFFEAFFFGGLKTNYKLEQNVSVFGAHIQDEQSASLKEAIVFHNLQLQRRNAKLAVQNRSGFRRSQQQHNNNTPLIEQLDRHKASPRSFHRPMTTVSSWSHEPINFSNACTTLPTGCSQQSTSSTSSFRSVVTKTGRCCMSERQPP